jgi:ABC-type bacteriocin/lantibiotic exporter with double-glycine peptidase domain
MLKRWNKQTNSMVGVNYNLQKLNPFALQMVSIFSKVVGVLILWLDSSHQGYFWGDIIHDKKSNE